MGNETDELSVAIEKLSIDPDSGPCIICDAWFGFPKEERPRRERILAVSRQIHNFTLWRSNYLKENTQQRASQVFVIGEAGDVESIKERLVELEGKEIQRRKTEDAAATIDDKYSTYIRKATFLPNKKLEDLAKDLLINDTTIANVGPKESIKYLSPDAGEKLNASKSPPKIVVVGMLVDRKVQLNRSKQRAESLFSQSEQGSDGGNTDGCSIVPVQLPLDVLNVKDLSEDEPLNIDTVMEMMERWWINCSRGTEGKNYFIDASARALLTHRQRHPKRVIHGGAKSF